MNSTLRFSAIDIGSNAIRLLFSRVIEKDNESLFFVKESLIRMPLRLGFDAFTTGAISEKNCDKFLSTLNGFKFLIEAILISIIGGIVGIILGLSFGNIVALFLEQDPVIPFDWVLYSIQICASMGIIFGLYPAIKASRLNPIDSMRYE